MNLCNLWMKNPHGTTSKSILFDSSVSSYLPAGRHAHTLKTTHDLLGVNSQALHLEEVSTGSDSDLVADEYAKLRLILDMMTDPPATAWWY